MKPFPSEMIFLITHTKILIASCCSVFFVLTSFVSAKDAGGIHPEAGKPQAATPYPYFTRPSAAGNNYDTWRDAVGPDVGVTKVDPDRLPKRVDNSKRPQFPPIYQQGKFNACGQYASTATIFTYEMNVANGTVADTMRFPAHFSWNMMNRAKNKGSEAYHGWEVAKRMGLPTIKSYGGVGLKKIGQWPNGYAIWRDAMSNRVAGYRYSPATSIDQLNEARGWLYDRNQPKPNKQVIGGLFAMDGRMGELKKVTVTIPKGQHAAGKDLWTRWGPTGFGHGMACVGYDDQVGYDLNGDGKITNNLDLNDDGKVTLADWERGAYIIVNSWGKKWSGDGRIYLLYSAMVDSTWKRGNYLGRVEVARYQPRMTLRLKLACDDRTDLRMTIGIAGKSDATAPEHKFSPEVFNGWPLFSGSNPGHVPMAGPGDQTPLEVGIDITSLLTQLGPDKDGQGRLFLQLSKAKGSAAKGKLHEAAIRTYGKNGKLLGELPVLIKGGQFGKSMLKIDAQLKGLPRK